ncbi:MAG: biopolymer transporter ExbD [Thermogutta sp.]|nr:biopolymer transporter ExbD [Thermogutta sp.]HPU07299.1 biopolymer transporter ExbD [Thermogutta sp.]HQF12529.1 biopolymer transporter ExbD [Thermogutta sp.]
MSVLIRNKSRALESLTMTPLIDVVFNLLIFFLIASKFAEEERQLPVKLPNASEAQPLVSKPRELFINIDQNGRFYVGGKTLTLAQLEKMLLEAWSANPSRTTVIIRADERCRLQPVVAAINACKKANISDYRLATRKTGPPAEAASSPPSP